MSNNLFTPLQLGPIKLEHRVVMAPLTRMRADREHNAPRTINADYYAQRATPGGLIIAEASQIVPGGSVAARTPGIHSREQIAGWTEIVNAVHAKGGVIFLQLWHVGRISHSSLQPDGRLPPSASAIKAEGKTRTVDGALADFETPRALTTAEVKTLVEPRALPATGRRRAMRKRPADWRAHCSRALPPLWDGDPGAPGR